ncbi:hypothetical protein DH2020_043703 [Rehmannia glutinosa]|uniref:Reverse transcriptase zinc-binding domain n=1 Tax=Rehmannia glutinosa TaxID=99300 RepID=A0ABR0UIW8_REHGL
MKQSQSEAQHTDVKDANVSALIEEQGNHWNQALVKAIFSPDEAQCILNIPLPESPLPDLWCWHLAKNGKHTVRSAYHAYINSDASPLTFSPNANSSSGPNPLWKQLWNLRIQPRIKHFLWRCCTGSISTPENLARHGLHNSDPCPLCKDIDSSSPHIFFHCPFATAIWKYAGLYEFLVEFQQPSWHLWIREFISPSFEGPTELIITICYLLWFHRNKSKFDSINMDPHSVVISARRLIKEFQEAQGWPERFSPSLSSHPLFGKPQPGPCIYVDGAISTHNNCAGVGIALLDDRGQFNKGLSKKFIGISNPEEAEFLAFREALFMAHNLSLSHFTIFGDAAFVVLAIHGETICPLQCQDTLSDIHRLKHSLSVAGIYWIPRDANFLAHDFAFFAKNMTSLLKWWSDPTYVHSQLDVFQQS